VTDDTGVVWHTRHAARLDERIVATKPQDGGSTTKDSDEPAAPGTPPRMTTETEAHDVCIAHRRPVPHDRHHHER
jgi:hypothetical protein